VVEVSKSILEYNQVDWVNTKNYDEVNAALGRHRKLIYNKFMNLEQRKVSITYQVAKDVIKEILDYSKIRVDEKNWYYLLSFAEVRGIINYKTLLSVYKDRLL